ncbi:hypothetical protein BJ875DRAFT_521691 [Amylocarpus encephaloides]|uniref:Myb-like domain-containing protein n=1 Tax=Amylocarpus encephaloides TaxID=45428 RepID=A0A9P7YAT2_9HELO|nr:hypothetical protein BJ875DRAFT_521691 [Amylocarpus encephaloides]
MNVSTPSSRNQGYDTAESRRSPRDRSPGRYNDPRDSDQYRGGSYRGTGERRRSIPDARSSNHSAFSSNNRELFAEGTRRDSTRDFSSREPPRGPKASINSLEPLERAPTGPRASIHAPSIHGPDFRSDTGFRGRGRGGRGRGWRDDSRDRSRDNDREYRDRDRRDDRGPPTFRDDRSRDRERWDPRDSFRGRRPPSPQGRGRSPTYSARESRDPPSTLDLDRGYRGSRDAPSTVSPSSDLGPQFVRGYGRVRASRGRGRGSYYDDYHRGPVRSRSPEQPAFTRRPLQSATPPPQVPAFGSTSVKPSITAPSIPAAPASSTTSLHSAPKALSRDAASLPRSVPTGPRAVVPPRAGLAASRSSPWARPPDRPSPEIRDQSREKDLFPGYLTAKDDQSAQGSVSNRDTESVNEDAPPNLSMPQNEEPQSAKSPPREETVVRKRFPVIGRRQPKIPSPITEDSDVNSDSADDDFPNSYFEDEIATEQALIAEVLKSNPLLPPHTPIIASDWRPLYSPIHDKIIPDPCEAPATQQDTKLDQAKATAPPRVSPAAAQFPSTSVERLSATPPRPKENSAHEIANADANIETETKPIIQGEKIEEDVAGPREENVKEDPVEKMVEDTKSADTAGPSNSDDQNTVMGDAPVTQTAALDTAFSPWASHEQAPEVFKELSPLPRVPEKSSVNGVDLVIKPEVKASTPIAGKDKASAPVNDLAEANLPNQHDAMDIDAPVIPEASTQPLSNGNEPHKPVPKMDQFEDSEGSVNEREKEEELESVRRMMKTPPISGLVKPNGHRFWEHPDLVADLEIRSLKTECELRMHVESTNARRKMERQAEGQAWAQRYYEYRKWTDFSNDPECIRSRDKFAASRARAAAEAAAPPISAIASASAKPQGRRGQGRFATEADLERVLKESAQESKEKELDERRARAKTADAKEATIPAMEDGQWWSENVFFDVSHRVPFERSFAILEYGEPIDNFTPEETEIFEKVYLETPKNWSRVADALAHRDFKACIQHYYLVKHSAKLKDKANGRKRKRGRGPAKGRPKYNALSASLGNGEDADENQDNENSERKGRPRRAAAPVFPIDAPPPNEGENGTPAPTPGRKTAGTPKAEKTDGGSEPGPAKKKVKVAREKGMGKAKNNQLLAAAPIAPAVPRRDDSPAMPIPLEPKNSRPSTAAVAAAVHRFPPQFDGPASQAQPIQPQPTFIPPFVPVERAPPTAGPGKFEILPQPHPQPQTPQQPPPQPYPSSERIEPTTPSSFDPQQDRRNTPQTSSYWSVPEQNDFPALLRHFGTDWQGIARHMTSKTHIMVYTNLFQHWLAVPSDSNKSRRVANILTQVKNYYQRQVDSGKMQEWEDITKEADAKRERGEHMGVAPTASTIPPKRRYDAPSSGSLPPRSGSALGHVEDLASPGLVSVLGRTSQASPPHSQSLSARFPALANAGPVPQIQPAPSPSVMSRQITPQPTQPSPHSQPASRMRGPPLGYFPAPEPPQRPPLQPAHSSSDNAISQRTLQATQAALLEKETALRLEEEQRVQREQRELQQIREQKEQQQQQQQQQQQRERERDREHREQLLREQQLNEQRERQQQTRFKIDREREQKEQKDRDKKGELESQRQWIQMKQEKTDGGIPNLQQYEPYSAAASRPNILAQPRPEAQQPVAEGRRSLPDQQFQSRPPPSSRNFINHGNLKPSGNSHRELREREMKSSASPVIHRALNERPPPPSAPPPQRNDQYSSVQNSQPTAQHIPQPSILQASHPPPPVAAVRQQEAAPRKTSNIMSLLNDEPSEPCPEQPKRVINIISTPQPISRTPPPPQMPLQSSRFATHQPPQTAAQPPQQASSQPPAHHAQQQSQHHVSHSPHPYAQASPHPLHQHSSSIGQARSYTPTSFDRRGYEANPGIQPPPSQPQLYTQPPPRQSIPQSTIRREPSLGDHGLSAEYGRGPPPQSSRLKQSPYSSTPPLAAPQPVRQQITSPLDLATPGERDFYARQPQAQYLMQQQSATASPQLGPSYQAPSQPPHPSHRQLAFGQGPPHMASPPSHFATQHHQEQYQRSRHNSITDVRDPRYSGSTTSGSTPSHVGYAAPQHQLVHPSLQYQHAAHQERFEYDRERRMQEERHQEDRRLLEDQRMRGEAAQGAAFRQSHHRRMEEPRR